MNQFFLSRAYVECDGALSSLSLSLCFFVFVFLLIRLLSSLFFFLSPKNLDIPPRRRSVRQKIQKSIHILSPGAPPAPVRLSGQKIFEEKFSPFQWTGRWIMATNGE